MIPASADGGEIAYTLAGVVGMVAVAVLLARLRLELRVAYASETRIDPLLAWVNLGLALVSLVKLAIVVAIGFYSMAQPPSPAALTTGAMLVRAGFLVIAVLMAAPPLVLVWARQRVDGIDRADRWKRQQHIREGSTYTGVERRRET